MNIRNYCSDCRKELEDFKDIIIRGACPCCATHGTPLIFKQKKGWLLVGKKD